MYFNYYIETIKKFNVFTGRSTRSEYWSFFFISLFIQFVLMFIEKLINFSYLSEIFALFIFLPNIAVSIRRLHDIGKSGWMLLINFIPLIGFIWFLVLTIRKGDEGDNKYGPSPINNLIPKNDSDVSNTVAPETFVTENNTSVSDSNIEKIN